MADLTDKQSAQTVKLVGADSNGVETDFVNVGATGVKTHDVTVEGKVDTLTSTLQTESDQTQVKLDDLKTEVDSSNYTMNEAFSKAQAMAGQLDEVSTTLATENNIAPVRITPRRALHSNLRDSLGNEILGPKLMESSIPFVIASDHPPITVISQQPSLTYSLYGVGQSINMTSAGVDNPLLLLVNPAGSGKTINIVKLSVGVEITNTSGLFKIFSNPTVTTNGTSLTPISRKVGDTVATIVQVFRNSSVSSSGNQFQISSTGQNTSQIVISDQFDVIINPGNSILVTGYGSANNRAAAVSLVWTEVVI